MKVFAVMILERHGDPDVELRSTALAAVERAAELAAEIAGEGVREGLTQPMIDAGWHYYASWGSEGEHVFVVEREVL